MSSASSPLETQWRILNWPARWRRAVALCFFAAVNWMLLAPSGAFREIHLFLAHEDKLAHGSIFLALAWLVRWSMPSRYGRGWQRFAALVSLGLYAGATETLQPLLAGAGRQFEWLDLASNFTGLAAGWMLLGAMIAGRPATSRKQRDLPETVRHAPKVNERVAGGDVQGVVDVVISCRRPV